jgi:NAD(P)-dependent dehydrogenase (short-subunit alcohol dehydrogenase family)
MRTTQQLGDLTGRTAIITGGAGNLGRAMASALLESGARVALVDREDSDLDGAAHALAGKTSGQVVACATDLESEADRLEVAREVQSRFETIDILINNAGFVGDSRLTGWVAPFEQQSMESWRRAMEVNLAAPFHLSQLLAPQLAAHERGSIINIGSIYGMLGPDLGLYQGTTMGNPGAYAASKGGLLQITRWLATSLAPAIRVNCITPGGIARGQPEVFVDRYVARTPLGRMGVEEDFKGAALFLASDLSRWVTGQNIVVDGGWSAW